MTTQPEALRLADKMSSHNLIGATALKKTADELRRLHEIEKQRDELLEALKIGVSETLDYIKRNHLSGAENNHWIVLARAAIAKAERTTT